MPFEEAVRRWGAPEPVAELKTALELFDRPEMLVDAVRARQPVSAQLRHLYIKADRSLIERLYGMELFCSGRHAGSAHGDRRIVILPERLHPDRAVFSRQRRTLTCDVGSPRERVYSDVEVFEYPDLPANVLDVPADMQPIFDALDAGRDAAMSAVSLKDSGDAPAESFHVQNDYAQVALGGLEYTLSRTQAAVVRELHRAFLAGDPWVHIDDLKRQTGLGSKNLSMLFRRRKNPDWRKLITSDDRGYYRLRMTRTS